MTDETTLYIATPCTVRRPERIDSILQKRMRDFLLRRRQIIWQKEGR